MKIYECDVAIVGAGPAGLAAAISAKENGAENVLIIERDSHPGGILQQCIHAGFGLRYFNEELTGPEYAQYFIEKAKALGIEILFDTMALEFQNKEIVCSNVEGIIRVIADSIVLAMGCRERTRANLVIPGSRPAGIYTAGCAQKLLNIQGHLVGKEVIILGSGDIGMIMARRMTLEGAHVKAVIEIMPYLAGLTRNKVQCLDDFGIPLYLSHTVVDITGKDRVEKVTIAPVDDHREPLMDKAVEMECDTLLLSVGLIPENELTSTNDIVLSEVTKGAVVDQFLQTDIEGIFACGNVLHVNDLVDNVTEESQKAGKYAALYAKGELPKADYIGTRVGKGVRYVCPQKIRLTNQLETRLFFRVTKPLGKSSIYLKSGGKILAVKRVIRLNPGEMESIVLPPECMPKLVDDVEIYVEEE